MEIAKPITRENVEKYLDGGVLYVAVNNSKWWVIRRNGKTQRWKRDPSKLRIPFKFGFNGYSAISDSDFVTTEKPEHLNTRFFRHREDVPHPLASKNVRQLSLDY